MTDLSKKIFDTIKEKKINPKPKWEFLLKNYIVWILGIISLIVGSLAMSVIIFMFKYSNFEMDRHINNNFFEFLLSNMPYFWIIFLIMFIFVADYNFRHTQKGYKYKLGTIILSSILISMFLGSTLYAFGSGEVIDNIMSRKAPFYPEIINRNIKTWNNPDNGALMGIVASAEQGSMNLISPDQKEWVVFYDEESVLADQNIMISDPVKVSGKKLEENIFKADNIFKMPPPGREFINQHRGRAKELKKYLDTEEGKTRMKNMSQKLEKYPELKEKMINRFNMKKEMIPFMNPEKCNKHEECMTPPEFMIRSNCPHESRCLENKCHTVCPEPFGSQLEELSGKSQCTENTDCNCDHYKMDDKKNCRCVDSQCLIMVD